MDYSTTPAPTAREDIAENPAELSPADKALAQAARELVAAAEAVKSARFLVADAGEDVTGLDKMLRDLNRELTWLNG